MKILGTASLVSIFPKTGSALLSKVDKLRSPRLADTDGVLELFQHALIQTNLGRAFRDAHLVDFLLQLEQPVKQVLGTRRTAHHVNVNRHNLVYTLQYRVGVEGAAHAGTRPHGDAPLWLRHLLPNTLEDGGH